MIYEHRPLMICRRVRPIIHAARSLSALLIAALVASAGFANECLGQATPSDVDETIERLIQSVLTYGNETVLPERLVSVLGMTSGENLPVRQIAILNEETRIERQINVHQADVFLGILNHETVGGRSVGVAGTLYRMDPRGNLVSVVKALRGSAPEMVPNAEAESAFRTELQYWLEKDPATWEMNRPGR